MPERDWKLIATDTGYQIPTVLYRTITVFSHKRTVNLGVLYPSQSCTLYPKFMYIYALVLTHHTSHKSEYVDLFSSS